MSTEMLMKNRERFIKNVNSNENGAAALSLRLFCYARFMAVKNPYAETHDWVYENELTSAQANQYVFRLLDGSTERPSMDMLIRKLKSVRLVRDSEMNGRKIYEFALSNVPKAMASCLEKSGIAITDVKKILIHQANEKMDEAIINRFYKLYKMETPAGIMPMSIHKLGNSSVATVPTLFDLIVNNELEGQSLNKGDVIIFASVGAGMNINANVYKM